MKEKRKNLLNQQTFNINTSHITKKGKNMIFKNVFNNYVNIIKHF